MLASSHGLAASPDGEDVRSLVEVITCQIVTTNSFEKCFQISIWLMRLLAATPYCGLDTGSGFMLRAALCAGSGPPRVFPKTEIRESMMNLLASRTTVACLILAITGYVSPAYSQSGGRVGGVAPQAFAPALAPAPATFGAAGQPLSATALSTTALATTACSPCAAPVQTFAQPTVALSPVAVQQPVVLQSVPLRPRLFDGRIIRWIFGTRNPVVVAPGVAAPTFATPVATTAARPILPSTAFLTTAYQPTLPLAGTAVLAPTFQTVARPLPLATTTFRPVTLASPCCSTCCNTGCCSGGVTTATFNAPLAGSCPNCAPVSGSGSRVAPFPGAAAPGAAATPTPAGETPQPGLSPSSTAPEQRALRPEQQDNSVLNNDVTSPSSLDAGSGSRSIDTGTDTDVFYQTPQLFSPHGRTTNRPTAPVWNAVYQPTQQRTATKQTVYQVGPDHVAPAAAAPRRQQSNAGGWRSVRD